MKNKPYLIRIIKDFFKRDFVKHFQDDLITGLLLALPTIATIWVLSFVIKLLGGPVGDIINRLLMVFTDGTLGPFFELILGFIVSVIILVSLGHLAKLPLIKGIAAKLEDFIDTLPFANIIYSTMKSLVNSIKANSTAFQSVAIIEYPRKGLYALAFVTQSNFPTVKTKSGKVFKEMSTVFMPTTPNPTTGFLIVLPKNEVEILDISVEEGIKIIVSAGVLTLENKEELLQKDDFTKK